MSCEVCAAPALPLAGGCAFCRSPLAAPPDPEGLLDYLAPRVPGARARRGLFGRGPVRDFRVQAAGGRYRARLRRAGLVLTPDLDPAGWVDRLLADLSADAARDGAVRHAVTRAGWALRR